jgi:hypothetical protein
MREDEAWYNAKRPKGAQVPDQSMGSGVGPVGPIYNQPEDLLENPTARATLAVMLMPDNFQEQPNETSESADTGIVPVSIYLADDDIHEQVEIAIEQWLATANASIETRENPVIGSWFRRMVARVTGAATSPVGREALLTATHVADSHLVQAQDAYVTSTLLQNVGPVLQALQPTKDAVVRAGALLIVKVEWVVQVHQLTAAQQAILDHSPRLAASPMEIITALQLVEPELKEGPVQSAPHPLGHGESAAATGE